MAELTPMMKQYFEIKNNYPDTILMFRLGDFYEMFYKDAEIASKELELVLTGKDCGQEERAPMCGIPFHAADSYVSKLVSRGYKVAICEQLEDPALAKGIVKRGVIRILTPGTVIESSMLDDSKNNYLCCIYACSNTVGLSFADVSTASFFTTDVDCSDGIKEVLNELGRFNPSEIIANSTALNDKSLNEFIKNRLNCSIEILDEDFFEKDKIDSSLKNHFNISKLSEISLDLNYPSAISSGASLNYLKSVQKNDLENIKTIDYYGNSSFMHLDFSTFRNLELVETMRNRDKKGSLLWVLDKTKTSMGKRMLRSYLEKPLMNINKITKRLNSVEELINKAEVREDISELLSGSQDLERLITRISYGTGNAREVRALYNTLIKMPEIKSLLSGCSSSLLNEISSKIHNFSELCSLINESIVEDPPFTVREGGLIKNGFNEELDELRNIVNNGKEFLADIQLREQEKTGIKKLKIGYNRVFGYYIEVSNSFKDLVPEEYIRKQTLANCERYITQELKELESKVLGSQERMAHLEYEIFDSVRLKITERLFDIQETASSIATIDVLCSFANVAINNNYVKPDLNAGTTISITNGRHPVVEKMLDSPFVPNDTLLDCGENKCAIITGPNMAGKSTYMRQVALICLMAQIGSFVPATSADLCIVDGIYTRIGASDDLSSGSSTFMVEMKEVADILSSATNRSLIIFDEIGRGTSTFDGMSIARAVLEYSADKKKLGAKTLFATHYHELTVLENEIQGVKNYNISVKKRGDSIIFLRRIVLGCADGSYGVEVAKLAGVPNTVVDRAKTILKNLESQSVDIRLNTNNEDDFIDNNDNDQLSFESGKVNRIIDELKMIDVNTLTPIEALTTLYNLAKEAQQ